MKKLGKMTREVLASLLKKTATKLYPAEKEEMTERFRGKMDFIANLCIGCKLCMRDCPADAIEINKIGEKKFEATFDLDKCIFCAQCVDTCPKKALKVSRDFELASLDRNKLRIVLHAPTEESTENKPTEPPAGTPK